MTVGSCTCTPIRGFSSMWPQAWITQPLSSDLGQMLTCRRMEWQKCTSLLKAWGGWTRHTIWLAIYLVQNVIKSKPYGQPSVQKLWFNCCLNMLNLAAVEARVGWRTHLYLPQHISVWTRLDYVVCEPLCVRLLSIPALVWLHKIGFRQHKASRPLHQGVLFSPSAGACLCLPWTSLVQSVIVAIETFHLQFAGWTSHQR